MKKINVDLKVSILIYADEDADIGEIINELSYNFSDNTGQAEIEDTSITGYDITDST